jgi:hypothetical protein
MPANTAAKAEADGTDITFKHENITYTIPASLDWPGDAIDAIEQGLISTFLQAVLGPKQWAQFKAAKPTARGYTELFDSLQTASGFSGN